MHMYIICTKPGLYCQWVGEGAWHPERNGWHPSCCPKQLVGPIIFCGCTYYRVYRWVYSLKLLVRELRWFWSLCPNRNTTNTALYKAENWQIIGKSNAAESSLNSRYKYGDVQCIHTRHGQTLIMRDYPENNDNNNNNNNNIRNS